MKKKILIILLILHYISPVASAEWDCFQNDIHHTRYHRDASNFVTNLWIFNMGSPIIGSPAINESDMYIALENGLLKCIGMEDSNEIWSLNLENTIHASPVCDNETVLCILCKMAKMEL